MFFQRFWEGRREGIQPGQAVGVTEMLAAETILGQVAHLDSHIEGVFRTVLGGFLNLNMSPSIVLSAFQFPPPVFPEDPLGHH